MTRLSASSPTGGGLGFLGPTTGYTNGDSSGLYWFAGGGGGGINPQGGGTPVTGYGGVGPGATTSPFAGAGNAGKDAPGSNALENSGSCGGSSGGGRGAAGTLPAGSGGSGIVIIRYPT